LASLWGNVVIVEDNTKLVVNPLVNTSPRKDVFEFAIRDLEFAAKYLPKLLHYHLSKLLQGLRECRICLL
jgi:hypothetical protein